MNPLSGTTPSVPSQDASEVAFIVSDTATPTSSSEASGENTGILTMDTVPLTPEEEKAGESLIIT